MIASGRARSGRYVVLLTLPVFVFSGAGASPAGESASEPLHFDHSYRLRLDRLAAPSVGPTGLLVRARINRGPELRLLLDSGAQHVVLDRRTAARSGCKGGAALDLVEPGAAGAEPATRLDDNTVAMSGLELNDVPVLISGRRLADGVDGVLPLSLFAKFLIRLDIPGRSLDLEPYPAGEPDDPGAVRAVASNRLLFLKGVFNETREGYFLLDTGASYNAISPALSRELNHGIAGAESISVQNGSADMEAPLFRFPARVRFGSRELSVNPVVAVDLSASSRYHGLEVSGLIGYPALSGCVITVNYRDGLVRIDPRSKNQ